MNALRRAVRHEVNFMRRAWRNPRVLVRRWRRMWSPRGSYIERNHDVANTLMLASSGRSGSTWLSEVLVETFSCRIIFEPFRRDRVPLSANMRWGHYVEPGRADPELERVMERIVTGRIRSPWVDQINRYRLPRRRLVKEIRVTNLLPWMSDRYPEMPIIYLLRHPVASAWSAAELGWRPFFSEFEHQQALMNGPLAPWRDVIARHAVDPDLFHRHVLRWCLENVAPIAQLSPDAVHVVFYEDLVEDPRGELRRLARYLGGFAGGAWAFDPARPLAVDRPSAANYRQTPMMSTHERLRSWVDTVPPPLVERAVALLEEFGLDRIYGDSVRPLVAAEAVLQGPPRASPGGRHREPSAQGEETEGDEPGSPRGTESSNSR